MTLLSALRFLWGFSIPTARVKNEATVLAESLNVGFQIADLTFLFAGDLPPSLWLRVEIQRTRLDLGDVGSTRREGDGSPR